MNNFGFEINLFLNDFNKINISPPASYSLFREITLEKFNLIKSEFFYQNEEGELCNISNDSEFFNLYNYISENNLDVITIYINPSDQMKKKKGTRKNSRSKKPNFESNFEYSGGLDEEDSHQHVHYDAENYKDLRNLKYNNELEEGKKYSKHGYNAKNIHRIEFIKQKKEILKEEQIEKGKSKLEMKNMENEVIEDKDFGKKNKNRLGNKVK